MQDLAHSDELWKPLCIARWPWLKSLKGGPAELLPPLNAYKNQVRGGWRAGGATRRWSEV